MKLNLTFKIIFLLFLFSAKSQDITHEIKDLTIGEIRIIHSEILMEDRTINIYLPPEYKNESNLPVIYLLDGSFNEDFIHIVGLCQFFNLMFEMPQFIVVGIENIDRKKDFTFPTQNIELKESFPTTGGSENFINFIEKELQPYIQQNFTNSRTKFIIGQSLGGLLATEILLKKAQLFSHYFIISPSLWWDDESLLENANSLLNKQNSLNFYAYISVGKEGGIMEKCAKNMYKKLSKVGKTKHQVITDFSYLPKENHATILHVSIYQAFKILYPCRY